MIDSFSKRQPNRLLNSTTGHIMRMIVSVCIVATIAASALAGQPTVLADGKLPNDRRLGPLTDLNGYFPFKPQATKQAWKERADKVRRRILLSAGLWPMPTKTPIRATIHGKIDRDTYTVEKVFFESFPGLYVTGSLYRPKGLSGKLPAVISPHGHWRGGRFHDHGEAGVEREIASGAEKTKNGGRHPLQARCVQLVRMGCVVFHYDMLGYADNVPITNAIAHGFKTQRPHMNTPEQWGLFSAQSELRLQNALGLQTLNSVRTLDWISSLPYVDAKRIGMTGASGGGTQTFILSAIDPRLAVSFPAVMVSTAMQGGCTCENATYLRIGTGNVEFAAMFSPRPLGLSAANDWTKEMPTKGFPELRQHYAMMGVPNLVAGRHFNFGHNYNAVSRAMMYDWFNRHLKLGADDPTERDYQPLAIADLSVWNDQHPKPESSDRTEAGLLKKLDADSQAKIDALTPKDKTSLAEFRRVIGGAFDVMIGRRLTPSADLEQEVIHQLDRGDYLEFYSLLRNTKQGEELPTLFLLPKKWNKQVVIWIDRRGKSALLTGDGQPIPAVKKLIGAGFAIASLDLLYQGEFLADGKPIKQTRIVNNPRQFAGFTLGYNHPLFSKRVHDILTMISYVRSYKKTPEQVHLVGLRGAGPWVAAACAQAGSAVDRIAIDTAGFRFGKLKDIRGEDFLPGGVKYGDVPSLLALCAPHEIWIAGETEKTATLATAAYRAAGATGAITFGKAKSSKQAEAVAAWLAP